MTRKRTKLVERDCSGDALDGCRDSVTRSSPIGYAEDHAAPNEEFKRCHHTPRNTELYPWRRNVTSPSFGSTSSTDQPTPCQARSCTCEFSTRVQRRPPIHHSSYFRAEAGKGAPSIDSIF